MYFENLKILDIFIFYIGCVEFTILPKIHEASTFFSSYLHLRKNNQMVLNELKMKYFWR